MTPAEKQFRETTVRMIYALFEADIEIEALQKEIEALRYRPLTRPETRVEK